MRTRATHRQSNARVTRLMLIAGIVLILSGIAVGGYLSWQYWGTNIVSKQRHSESVTALEKSWAGGEATAEVEFGTAEAIIKIPAFGAGYAIPIFEGTSESVLAAGFGRFDSSAGPGELGNYALAAHRITHGEPLRRMRELEVGDEVIVVTRETTYVYELVTGGDDLTVDFTAGWVLDPMPTNPVAGGVQPAQDGQQSLITLTTCSELFHTDNRLIAFGLLKETRPTS